MVFFCLCAICHKQHICANCDCRFAVNMNKVHSNNDSNERMLIKTDDDDGCYNIYSNGHLSHYRIRLLCKNASLYLVAKTTIKHK